MHRIDVVTADKLEGWFEQDNTVHFRGSFVLHGGNGADSSASVVIELEPGKALGEHTDSPEEILIVIEGDVECQFGDERERSDDGNRRSGSADDAAQHAQCGHDTSQDHRLLPKSARRFRLR